MASPELLQLASSMPFIDEVYEQYLLDPANVDESWRRIFEAPPDLVAPASSAPATAAAAPVAGVDARRLLGIFLLVRSYRVRGHLEAWLDPLEGAPPRPYPELDPRTYGFTEEDLDRVVVPPGTVYGLGEATLRQAIARLRETYCRSIGVEFMHIATPARRAWLEERMETSTNRTPLDRANELHMLDRLVAADAIERFVHQKYAGTKRFSLEGGETMIPLLDRAIERAGRHGIKEIVIGMAHRGRLNVLANIMSQNASRIFEDFEDLDPQSVLGGGDVKYHLGHSCDYATRAGDRIHLSLTFNPSHLEAVDPVVLGRVRAKQRRHGDTTHEKVLGILLHGDAAFAGQGMVPEVMNLSQLIGYRTGGTLHVVVNNQIGFTTSPTASRSTAYPTDIAKGLQVPIFHANGDDPAAVAHVVDLAMDYRREFKSNVVIDMFCFRRHGHNEVDEPSFTQPLLYKKIERHAPVWRIYGDDLVKRAVSTNEEVQAAVDDREKRLELDLVRARQSQKRPVIEALGGYWSGYEGGPEPPDSFDTAVARERLVEIGAKISTIPEGFTAHPKIVKLMESRAQMARGEKPLDWAMGEALSYGSLVWEGRLVRHSGQDARRGTFSQRHAVIVDITNGNEHYPLKHLHPQQGTFQIYDSMLSEQAVLGFDFGYSLDYPEGLVIWEAQFGDFVNGAQVIVDQFVSSCEDKWKRLSGLVMFLPHGYEGQGPEHSSARYERFLTLAAEDNLQVCYPTSPAQHFHLLRRQVLRKWRKPLIVMTPKSLLRDPRATSSLDDCARGRFQALLEDPSSPPEGRVQRIVLCTGKVYYDLDDERKKRDDRRTAIIRLEQLYPWREEELGRALARYPDAASLVWVQEEPANMGARSFVGPRLVRIRKGRSLATVCRPESASPATGSAKAHAIEQRALIEEAFADTRG